jgi:hypothetical protein
MNMQRIPPGYKVVPLRGGGQALVADNAFPIQQTSGDAYQRTHGLRGLGQHPQEFDPSPDYPGMLEVPAFYTITVLLGGDDNAVKAGSVTLRPEPFIVRRITWATTGDAPLFITIPSIVGSAQGRVVEITWDDEFTKFLGQQPCLISALFGDSQGFLDLPKKGLLFQGKQTLSVNLHRLIWPDPTSDPAETRFDFNFQGVMLLPQGVNQSGSAG